jgi:hypothetical protein
VTLSKELLDILVCPKCKGEIQMTENEDGLVCERCKLRYPVKDDIPVMLIEEAVPLAGPAPSEGAR